MTTTTRTRSDDEDEVITAMSESTTVAACGEPLPFLHGFFNGRKTRATTTNDTERNNKNNKEKKTFNDNNNNNMPTIASLDNSSIKSLDKNTKQTSSVIPIATTATATTATASSSLSQWLSPFQRRYTFPDKTVASQVLMYRQLLHTNCRPGLRLTRPYQGTTAQRAVLHMPWWEQGVERTKKMTISYDNLIVRLWLNGAVMPYEDGGYATPPPKPIPQTTQPDLLLTSTSSSSGSSIDTMIDTHGLPPIPHSYWIDRLGFQQSDPITDFRSGGVLSLAMMVHLVESCPILHARFLPPNGDACVLPFAITCINVMDMLAKFLMLSKSIDKIDALLSQKPYWNMFAADPNALLVCTELSMGILADVVMELETERRWTTAVAAAAAVKNRGDNNASVVGMNANGKTKHYVTVFDFTQILQQTEHRVYDDLLRTGPKTVEEMRMIDEKNRTRYQSILERKVKHWKQQCCCEEDGFFGRWSHSMRNVIMSGKQKNEKEEEESGMIEGLENSELEIYDSTAGVGVESSDLPSGNFPNNDTTTTSTSTTATDTFRMDDDYDLL